MKIKNTALIISERNSFIQTYSELLKKSRFKVLKLSTFKEWKVAPDRYQVDLCCIDNPEGTFDYREFFDFLNNFSPHSIIVNFGASTTASPSLNGNLFFTTSGGKEIDLESFFYNIGESFKRAKTRTELAAMLIHDIRSPLNSLIAYIDLLLNQTFGKLNEGQLNFLEKAMNLGDQILDMLEDINEVYKNEQYTFTLDEEVFPINKVLDQALVGLWVQADSKNIKITRDIPADLPRLIGDTYQIQRIFTNLIENAIKYCPNSAQIQIKASRHSDKFALFSIIDNGGGIPDDKLKKIFLRSFRGDEQETVKGTGLGLYICKIIVKAHGGKIWAENNDIGGVTFHFILPLQTSGK